MNAEKIIKALECCGSNPPKCSICDYRGKIGKKDCYDYLKADALALIKEQQAEIEKYKKLADLNEQDNKDTCELLFKEEEKCKDLQAHNENLKRENKYLRERLAEEAEIKEDMGECFFGVDFDIKALKADTVKRMQERLKELAFPESECGWDCVYIRQVDGVAKEILEGKK